LASSPMVVRKEKGLPKKEKSLLPERPSKWKRRINQNMRNHAFKRKKRRSSEENNPIEKGSRPVRARSKRGSLVPSSRKREEKKENGKIAYIRRAEDQPNKMEVNQNRARGNPCLEEGNKAVFKEKRHM